MEQKIYKSGDVVWVMPSKRLGWWPGRVQNVDDLRQELKGDVTDKTIAVVKYLNEDNYQFVEDETIICAYGSDRKTEYISLGMSEFVECVITVLFHFFLLHRQLNDSLLAIQFSNLFPFISIF